AFLALQGSQGFFRGGGVLSDKQIQVAVLVQVHESAAQADGSELVQPGGGSHVFKASLAVVAKQPLPARPRAKPVGKLLVVAVADAAAQAGPRPGQSRFGG